MGVQVAADDLPDELRAVPLDDLPDDLNVRELSAPAGPKLAAPVGPKFSPTEPQIGPTKPSFLEEATAPFIGRPGERTVLGRLLYGEEATPQGADYGRGYNLPLVKSKELIPEGSGIAGSFGRGVLGTVDELTSPGNLALAGGVGAGEVIGSKVLSRLISAGFSADMAHSLYQQYPQFKQAVDAGDYQGAAEMAGKMVATGALSGLAATHALTPSPKPLGEPPERIVARQVVNGQMSAKDAIPTAQFLKSIETPQPPEPLPQPEIPVQEKTWLPADVNRKALPPAKPEEMSLDDFVSEVARPMDATVAQAPPRPPPEIVKPTETSRVIARNLEPLPETKAPVALSGSPVPLDDLPVEAEAPAPETAQLRTTPPKIEDVRAAFQKSQERAPVVTDPAQVQEIKNSIAEGEMILKSGKKTSGKQMSPEELEAVKRSVENSRAKIGVAPVEESVAPAKEEPPAVQATPEPKIESQPEEVKAEGLRPAEEPVIPETKRPWQVRRDQYARDNWQGELQRFRDRPDILDAKNRDEEIQHFKDLHLQEVARALKAGKDVPEEVLADYPRLAKKAKVAAKEFLKSEEGSLPIGKAKQKIDVSGIDDVKTSKAPLGERVKEKAESSWDNFIRRHYDQFIHVKRLVEAVHGKAGARELPAEQDPYKTMRTAFGGTAGGKSELAFLDYGSVVKDASKEGLDDALSTYLRLKGKDRAISVVEEKLADRKQKMRAIRSEVRNLNQMIKTTEETKGSFGGREATKLEALNQQLTRLNREAGNLATDATRYERELRENKVVPGGDNHQTIARKLAELKDRANPEDYAKVEQYAKSIFDLNRRGWDLAHESGLISDELHDKGLRRGNEYVTMSRVTDDVPQAEVVKGAGMSAKQVIKPLEGSERELKDPIEASMNMHQDIIRQSVKNETVKKFVGWANGPESKGVVDIRQLKPNEQPSIGNGEISFREGGKLQRYQVDQKLADTINLADAATGDYVGKTFMNFMNRFVKGAITGYNLAFSIPNVSRDVRTQAFISKAGLKNPITHPLDLANLTKEWVTALKQQNENDPSYRAFLDSGAGFSTMQSRLSPAEFTGREKGTPILRTIGNLNQRLETATKLATWKRAKAMGMSDADAAWEARNFGGSPDFGSKGTKSGITGTIFLFLNARVQGAGQTLKGIQRNPARFGYMMAAYTAAELAIQSWNNQFKNPDDGQPEWDHVSDTDKQNYTIIFRPSTEQKANGTTRYRQVRIPKSHLEQTVLNPVQEAIAGMMGNRFDATQTALDAATNLLPLSGNVRKKSPIKDLALGAVSSLNPVFKEGIEQAANLDTFRKVPIVPKSMEDVEPRYQYRSTTPELAKRAGETFGVSPLRAEHAARSFGLGSVLGAGDLFLKDTKGKMPLEGDEAIGRTPIVGDIFRRFVGGSSDEVLNRKSEDFYDYLAKSGQARTTVNMLKKSNPEEAQQRMEDPEFRKLYQVEPRFQKMSKDLSEVRNRTRRVQQSEDLSDDQKKQEVKSLYRRQVQILDHARDLMSPR